ncbi:hypothetical protein BN77_p250035 [Rhizobium mesoamericanum STM3625]|uniref:Uncharacterized protein n=1 Tax=Rhizobium mesoamericanum STM3625 TaxID=1211777 RepID=K0Q6R3_9HYPH|nr:hypothetical protein BN77_p250035 [Rhizobium mesoamericanum STM3625]
MAATVDTTMGAFQRVLAVNLIGTATVAPGYSHTPGVAQLVKLGNIDWTSIRRASRRKAGTAGRGR